jgi:hypothetical protein
MLTIIVMSGLNLTACNNVILLDLWWNPALEVSPYDTGCEVSPIDSLIFVGPSL